MLLSDLLKMSVHNLFLHKVRSILTSLGIIFGVGSVISMLAISEGAKRESLAEIEAMGTDKIFVFSKKPSYSSSEGGFDAGMVQEFGINGTDLNTLMNFENIERITTARNARKKILKGATQLKATVVAVSADFISDSKSEIIEGRWFAPSDFRNKLPICIIGKNVRKNMFSLSKRDVIGETIRVENFVLKIIGIIENNVGSQLPEIGSPNDMIIITQESSDALFGGNAYVMRSRRNFDIEDVDYDLFIINISDISFIDDTAKRIRNYMNKTHRKFEDWGMIVPYDLLRQREKAQNIFTVIMSSIAGISLLVGGIGIMNIMLANVYERRKEIGTRMALGAKKKDILCQFLAETVLLTLCGCGIGVVVGVILSESVTYYADWKVVFTFWSFALSLIISTVVGIVFGTYPAWKASRQNPIEILRTE
ncbi:MAG TPA: ABC transporter permease [Victivallales bacterium]|nr:ABC transporter permease [Victivallales bacterium]